MNRWTMFMQMCFCFELLGTYRTLKWSYFFMNHSLMSLKSVTERERRWTFITLVRLKFLMDTSNLLFSALKKLVFNKELKMTAYIKIETIADLLVELTYMLVKVGWGWKVWLTNRTDILRGIKMGAFLMWFKGFGWAKTPVAFANSTL